MSFTNHFAVEVADEQVGRTIYSTHETMADAERDARKAVKAGHGGVLIRTNRTYRARAERGEEVCE